MTRSHASARKAGTWMESAVAARLSAGLGDDRIERRAKSGGKDRGDITGIRTLDGQRFVIEVKNTAKLTLGPWLNEAEVERGNDDAGACAVVAKRVGMGEKQMGQQLVIMTLDDLIVLLGGKRMEE